jgi:seryl-tRNA synthetase
MDNNKNISLYELTHELTSAMNGLEIDEETGEINGIERLEAVEADFDAKAEAVALYIKDTEATAEAIKAEADKLTERRKQAEKKAAGLKDYLTACMEKVGRHKMETPRCSVSFRKSEQTNILDEALIPAEYKTVKVTETVNKTDIKKAIKAGAEIPGAELVTCNNIQIK